MTEADDRSTDWALPVADSTWELVPGNAEALQRAVDACPADMSIVVLVPADETHSTAIFEIWPSKGWVRGGPSGTALFAQITPEEGAPPPDEPTTLTEDAAPPAGERGVPARTIRVAVGSHLVPIQIAGVLSP